MPKVPMNPENEEAAVILTSAESWRVPTEAIEKAVEEAIGELSVGNGRVTVTKDGATVATFRLNDNTDTSFDVSAVEVDAHLDHESANPVQNAVITNALDNKAERSGLADVAFSGNYHDLSDTPTIDSELSTSSTNAVQNKTITTALNRKANDSDLAVVAKSGAYGDLSGRPTIGSGTLTIQKNGTNVQTFNANATGNATANIAVPTTVAELDDASDYAYAADLIQLESSLAEVALTGSHNDLRDIPTIDATISASSTNAVQNQAVAAALANKADSSSIGNGTLTIKRNGTSVATFSANSSTAAEADISVPTAVSQLSDASSYYTKTQVDDAISGAVSASLKYKGSCTFANLPASGMQVGDVWNITDDFTLDGEPYTAGTNVAWNGTKWDPLAPAIDLSPYALASSIGNGTITVATTTANVDTFTTNQSANKTITIPAATASAHGTVIVDSALSASSNNPVRNSVIYAAIGDIETILNTLNSGTGA